MTESNNHKDLSLIGQYLCNKYWFIGSVALCLLIAFIYLSFQPERYKVSGSFILNSKDLTADDIRSRPLIQKVIDQLPLQVDYYQIGADKTSEIYGDALPFIIIFPKHNSIDFSAEVTASIVSDQVVRIVQNDTTAFFYFNKLVDDYPFAKFKVIKGPAFHTNSNHVKLKFNAPDGVLEQYAENFSVTPVDDANKYLAISIITSTPEKGKDFFNKLVEVINSEPVTGNSGSPVLSNNTSALARLQSDIITLKTKYAQLKKRAGSLKNSKASSGAHDGVKKPSDLQLKVLDAIKPYVKSPVNQFVQIPDGYQVDDNNLAQLITSFNKTELEKQRTLQDSEANRAKIVSLNKQIAGLKTSILKKIDINKNKANETLPPASNSVSGSYAVVRDSMSVIDKQVKVLQMSYTDLSKNNTVKVTPANPNSRLTLVQNSIESTAYPNAGFIYFFAFLTGLLVPLAFPYFSYLKFRFPNIRISNAIDFKKAGDWISEFIQVKEID